MGSLNPVMALDVENTSSFEWSNLSISEENLTKAGFDYYNVEDRAKKFLNETTNILTLVLGCLGVIANAVTLVAMGQMKGPLTSRFKCIISLVVSDLMIALSMVVHLINFVVNPRTPAGRDHGPADVRLKSHCAFVILKALNSMFLNVTLLNLVLMAVDIYIAIFKPFQHHKLLSSKRTNGMIITVWIVAFCCGFSDFISPLFELDSYNQFKYYYNYCEFIYITTYQEEYTIFAISFLALVAMCFMYIHIYRKVKKMLRYGPPGHDLQNNKKAIVTTVLILGTYILCWTPMSIFQIVMVLLAVYNPTTLQNEDTQKLLVKMDKYLYHLMIINTILDPLIYTLRLREVRYGYVQLLLRVCPGWRKGKQIIKRMNIKRSNSVVATSVLERWQSQMSDESNDVMSAVKNIPIVPNSKRLQSSSPKLSIAAFAKVNECQSHTKSPEERAEIQEETSLIENISGTNSSENTTVEQCKKLLPATNENAKE